MISILDTVEESRPLSRPEFALREVIVRLLGRVVKEKLLLWKQRSKIRAAIEGDENPVEAWLRQDASKHRRGSCGGGAVGNGGWWESGSRRSGEREPKQSTEAGGWRWETWRARREGGRRARRGRRRGGGAAAP